VGFDLSPEELAPFPKGSFTGIKYHCVTGGDVSMKEIYDRKAAEETARRHARHFVERSIAERKSVEADDWIPIVIAPFDAELFGHWWFEGPIFLEQVILAVAENKLLLTTPSEFLTQHPPQQASEPAA